MADSNQDNGGATPSETPGERLDSWKEIALFL